LEPPKSAILPIKLNFLSKNGWFGRFSWSWLVAIGLVLPEGQVEGLRVAATETNTTLNKQKT